MQIDLAFFPISFIERKSQVRDYTYVNTAKNFNEVYVYIFLLCIEILAKQKKAVVVASMIFRPCSNGSDKGTKVQTLDFRLRLNPP